MQAMMIARQQHVDKNREFLTNFSSYITKEWKGYYFAYDFFKSEYKKRKGMSLVDIQDLDRLLLIEIQRVHRFLTLMTDAADSDLENISDLIEKWQNNPSIETDRNIELSLRNIYQKIRQCEDFFKLNHFAISKICKKMEKLNLKSADNPVELSEEAQILLSNYSRHKDRVLFLDGFRSGIYFYDDYYSALSRIEKTRGHCIDVYTLKFRRTYAQLAHYELFYVKKRDKNHKNLSLIGLKLGLSICILLWVIVDSNSMSNNLNFWQRPGLFVYTTVGNLLLYRTGWATQVYIWSKFDVNYVSVLQLGNIAQKLDILVIDKTATLLVMYAANLLLFFKANSPGSALSNTFLSYACPFFLVISAIVYQTYESVYGHEHSSCGVFTKEVLRNCFRAPFVPVRFRDVYAADILTSFTKVVSDALYASCWLISGSFLEPRHEGPHADTAASFGSSYMQCTGQNMMFVTGFVQTLPLLIRTLQCLRACSDGRWKMYPHGYNALKYILSIGVVFVGLIDVRGGLKALYTLVCITALYKWWWDVVMDWGLGEIKPKSLSELVRVDAYQETKMFLRHIIMYPSLLVYYLCVLLDLLLRLSWVASLLPTGALGHLVGYQLSFFLGTLEIARRAMWGCFRLEWEHVKLLQQNKPGFLSTPVIRGFSRRCSRVFSEKSVV